MHAQATSAAVCPECATRLEEGFSRSLGRCMICLLRIGFDDVEEPSPQSLPSWSRRVPPEMFRFARHERQNHREIFLGNFRSRVDSTRRDSKIDTPESVQS